MNKNINEFARFLLDNILKSELEKKIIENNNEINLKQANWKSFWFKNSKFI